MKTLDYSALTTTERIALASELWDSVASHPESLALTDAQREILEARLAAYRAQPGAAQPWEAVRKRLEALL